MMRKKLNQWITQKKGHDYRIDERIPASYLNRLLIRRFFMLLRGFFSGIKNDGSFFLSGNAVIKAKRKFRVGHSVTIDSNVYIDALSTNGILFGNNVSVGRNTKIEGTGNLRFMGKGMVVGNNVGLGTDCYYGCSGGIIIGDDTIIGNYVSFHAENHVFDDPGKLIRLQGVTHMGIKIGKNCWLGAKVTVLDGAVIEDGCVIAAGAIVKAGMYAANGIYAGIPATLVRYRNKLSVI